jgi:hypothetical protein
MNNIGNLYEISGCEPGFVYALSHDDESPTNLAVAFSASLRTDFEYYEYARVRVQVQFRKGYDEVRDMGRSVFLRAGSDLDDNGYTYLYAAFEYGVGSPGYSFVAAMTRTWTPPFVFLSGLACIDSRVATVMETLQ